METRTVISLMLKKQKIRNALKQATCQTTVLFRKHNCVTSACLLEFTELNRGGAKRQEQAKSFFFLGSVLSYVKQIV